MKKEKKMEKIRVLMIDDNENLVNVVSEYFSAHEKIEVVLKAYDGKQGLEVIQNKTDEFDVVILDLIMPKKDGIYVLEEMKKEGIDKKVIVSTSFNEEATIRRVSSFGVSYFILKPFDLFELEKTIYEITKNEGGKGKVVNLMHNDLQICITRLLHSLGMPSHIKGYNYIREGITLLYNNPDMVGAITKELYPEIAKKFDTTVSRVERAIRHAIEVSWNRGNWELMEEIFGHSVDIDKAKPTNSEFIVTVSDKLKLEFKTKLQTM